MATNHNRKSKPVKKNDSMNGAMDFFIVGCLAELFLLTLRRNYIGGSALQQIAWYDTYLKVFMGIGAVILVAGLALFRVWGKDQKKKTYAALASVLGVFLAVSSALVRWNMSSLTLLMVVVPVAMILCIVWCLYDKECALALTVLAVSLVALWLCRRVAGPVALVVKGVIVLYIVAMVALIVLAKAKKLKGILSAKADPMPVYVSCGLSAAALAVALISSGIAYYAMWALAAVVFALAVYYTVKQL